MAYFISFTISEQKHTSNTSAPVHIVVHPQFPISGYAIKCVFEQQQRVGFVYRIKVLEDAKVEAQAQMQALAAQKAKAEKDAEQLEWTLRAVKGQVQDLQGAVERTEGQLLRVSSFTECIVLILTIEPGCCLR